MKSVQNIFTSLLGLLKVKHTAAFSNKFFNEHPHKYNMFGLSKMLSDYGIRNAGTRIEDKETDIFNIECPFVAHAGGDFVVVWNVENPTTANPEIEREKDELNRGVVHFIRDGKKITAPVAKFIQSWTGVILLAETTPDSIEPNYREHRKNEWLAFAQQSILALADFLIFGMAYFNYSLYTDLGVTFFYFSILLGYMFVACW